MEACYGQRLFLAAALVVRRRLPTLMVMVSQKLVWQAVHIMFFLKLTVLSNGKEQLKTLAPIEQAHRCLILIWMAAPKWSMPMKKTYTFMMAKRAIPYSR